MKKGPTKEELKELERIRKLTNDPKPEFKDLPIVKNGSQFKVAIPKKFTDFIELKENQKAYCELNKKEKKIIIEIK